RILTQAEKRMKPQVTPHCCLYGAMYQDLSVRVWRFLSACSMSLWKRELMYSGSPSLSVRHHRPLGVPIRVLRGSSLRTCFTGVVVKFPDRQTRMRRSVTTTTR